MKKIPASFRAFVSVLKETPILSHSIVRVQKLREQYKSELRLEAKNNGLKGRT